tara:strand:+ start:5287 stop:6204 length:918 start_codon:yes stop_codon:yes gene_type:complete
MVNKGLSPDRLGEMNSRHKQSLENIKQLQNMEKELYASLDTSVSGRSISKAEQTKIINKINELSTMRMNLYMNMKDMYLFLQTNVSDTRNNLVNDLTNIGVVEGELNNAKKQLKVLEKERYDKLRMVEVNTYYSDRYQAHTKVMKIVIFTSLPLLLVALLTKKGFIPSNISSIIIGVIAAIGIILVTYSIIDISKRDNMNFNEYKGPRAGSTNEDSTEGEDYSSTWNNDGSNKSDPKEPCVGKDCCTGGMIFNQETQQCQDVTESMVSNQLVKGSMGMANENISLQDNGTTVVMPFSDTENYAAL